MNLLEQFVTDQMQFVTDQMQIVKIAGAGVVHRWWWGGCVVAFAAGVLGVLLREGVCWLGLLRGFGGVGVVHLLGEVCWFAGWFGLLGGFAA